MKESVPERGDCASAVAATALKLSADVGSGSWGTGPGGRGCRSVCACVESHSLFFFSGECPVFEYAIALVRPRSEPFEAAETDASRDARDVDVVELYERDAEGVVAEPLLVLGLVDVGDFPLPKILPPPPPLLNKPPPIFEGVLLCILAST